MFVSVRDRTHADNWITPLRTCMQCMNEFTKHLQWKQPHNVLPNYFQDGNYLRIVVPLQIPHSGGELVFSCSLIEQLSNLLDNYIDVCVFLKRGVSVSILTANLLSVISSLRLCVHFSSAGRSPWKNHFPILLSFSGPVGQRQTGRWLLTSRHKDKQTWSFYSR